MKKERLQQTMQKHKGSLRDHYKQPYANKMDNLEEMNVGGRREALRPWQRS